MSFQVEPGKAQTAAQNLANIHSTLEDASASVAEPTTAVAAAAEDQVSAGVAAVFNSFGLEYQVLSAQTQAFHADFVNLLNASVGAYVNTEVANAEQALMSAVDSPIHGLMGAAAGASGAVAAVATNVSALPAAAALPILGGLGGSTVAPLLGGFGGGAPVASLLGGLGNGAPLGPLLGGLGSGSLSNVNGVVAALNNSSAFAVLSGPIGAGLQTLSRDFAALPSVLESCGNALTPSLLHAGASTGGVTGPYQTLFDNTVANLQTLGGAISANPAPLLHQLITNATGYANTIAADLQYVIQNFPTVLANLPTNIQAAFQALLAFNPAPYIQQFINNQMTFANMWATALQGAGQSFVTGLQALPAAFQSAFQELLAGNIGGALADVTGGFLNLFVTGVNVTTTGSVTTPPGVTATITPSGTVEDLLPLLTIPAMRAQNLTNLLPSGSIASQVAQNVTNVIQTVTDTSLGAQALLSLTLRPPSATLSVNLAAGLPVALGLDAIGAPINALDAASAGASQLIGQLQTGNSIGAISTLADGPAYVSDAFLNGQSTMPISFDISGYAAKVNLPLNGILVPQTGYTASVNVPPVGTITTPVGGTPLSGLATALLVYAPEQLASAIAAGI